MPMRPMKRLMLLAVALAAGAAPSPASPQDRARESTTYRIAGLAWLAGDWQTPAEGGRQVDEHWTVPLGGAMMGVSRTVANGEMTGFEYLRIVERADDLVYIAHPDARAPGTEFRLTRLTAEQAVFENPAHDYPKRISYRRNADGSLTASIDGGEGTLGPTFPYLPMVK
jgi:hypothetical protein